MQPVSATPGTPGTPGPPGTSPSTRRPPAALFRRPGGLLPLAMSALPMALGILPGCNTPSASQFAAVRPGMTEAEVEDLLGRPTSTRVVPDDRRDVLGYSQRWMYGDSLSSLATNALFTEGPDERVFVVLFDDRGRVLRTQVPSSGPRELVNKPE